MPKVMECCSKVDFGTISGRGQYANVIECCSKTSFLGTRKMIKMIHAIHLIYPIVLK